jgi:hypothetical protein
MRKFLILSVVAILAAPSIGCNSCGRPMMRWFNRGDSCRTCDVGCEDGNCHDVRSPGLLGSPMLSAPYSGTESLPGPATILPAPRQ